MLGFAGHKAEAVFRAEEALQVFEPGKFDLVITDYAMPGMKGDSLAAAIRARAPAQRIVILTGFGEVLEASAAPEAADFVAHKPFNTMEFLAAIGRLFETRP